MHCNRVQGKQRNIPGQVGGACFLINVGSKCKTLLPMEDDSELYCGSSHNP